MAISIASKKVESSFGSITNLSQGEVDYVLSYVGHYTHMNGEDSLHRIELKLWGAIEVTFDDPDCEHEIWQAITAGIASSAFAIF